MHFFASIDHLHDMLSWIRVESEKIGFQPSQLYHIELASEEAIVNVIHYTYNDQGGEIEISIDATPHQLQITISDLGKPFNPIAKKAKQTNASLDERKVGGLGLLLIQKCMDEVSYQRQNNRNVLTLIKKIN